MKKTIKPICLALTASLTLLTGCLEQGVVLNKPPATVAGPGRFTGNPARLSRIELRVSQFTQLEQGQSAQLEVVAFDDQGNQIDPALLNLNWSAENGAALNVDAQGRVTGLQPVAISNVTVTDTNTNVSDTGQVAVTGPFTGDPAALERMFFAFANQSLLNQGDSVPFVLIAVDNQGRPIDPAKLGQINWAVSDTSRFAIDAKGVVTALTSGQAATPAQVTATHAASGKVALGSVDMLRGGNGGGDSSSSPSPSAPAATPGPTAAPTAQPSATPSATPTVTPTPAPTATPSTSATPLPTPVPSSQLTGNPAQLASISISPSIRTLDDEGDKGDYFVIAIDTSGNYIDPSTLNFTWSTNKPSAFKVDGNGAEATVTALDNSGFADIIVTESGSGKTATAKVNMGSGGSGGGGGGTPSAGTILTEPVVDGFDFSYAGGSDGKLYAFDREGDPIWSFQANGAITRNPAGAEDGTEFLPAEAFQVQNHIGGSRLFFGTDEGRFYSLEYDEGNNDEEGVLADGWPVNVGAAVTTAPMVAHEADDLADMVVFGDAEGRLHSYEFDGDELWEGPVELSSQALISSPVLHENYGVILLGNQEGMICPVDAEDGFDDCYDPDESIDNAPFVADPVLYFNGEDDGFNGEDNLVIGDEDGMLYEIKLFANGEADDVRTFDVGEPIRHAVAIGEDDSDNGWNPIYVPHGGSITALNSIEDDGMELVTVWEGNDGTRKICSGSSEIIGAPLLMKALDPRVRSFSTAAIDPDATGEQIYVTCSDGRVYQVDASDGEVIGSSSIGNGSNLIAGPATTFFNGIQVQDLAPEDNGVLVGGADGKMHVLEAGQQFLDYDGDNWAKFRFDPFNSGVYRGQCCEG